VAEESRSDLVAEVRDVKKTYLLGRKDVLALRGVSLSIKKGEVVALAGTSGSGKSTLLNLLGCLDEPSEGQVKVFGMSTAGSSDQDLSRVRAERIGFIFQNFNLIPVLTALENVEYALVDRSMSSQERTQLAKQALQRVGLGDRTDHRPDELSGGQRQRVAIARAIVHKPSLIIADEPTAALDKKTAVEILDLLQAIRQEMGVTVIMASHDPLVLSKVDRVVHLSDGRVQDDLERGGK
jgi:putative ABC transport system ATP-binding protein